MLEDLLSPPIWRTVNSVNIWNLLWLSSRLIFLTEKKKTFTQALRPNTLTPKMDDNHEISHL